MMIMKIQIIGLKLMSILFFSIQESNPTGHGVWRKQKQNTKHILDVTVENMGMSAKERMAKWRERQRADAEKYENYKIKERERYNDKKRRGVVKAVSDMSTREARKVRRNWKKNSETYRRRKKIVGDLLTPPTSPVNADPPIQNQGRSESMKKTARKNRRREKARVNRFIEKLQIKIQCKERLAGKYKKRYQRLKFQLGQNTVEESKSYKFTQKAYCLYQTITQTIRKRYNDTKSFKEKQKIASLITSHRILRQYGLCTYARSVLGISRRHLSRKVSRKPNIKRFRLKLKVQEFFQRDDVTRMKSDKQATITRKGEKRQVRLLTDDIKNCHAKFLSENNKISYSLFCKLRPFWVIKPTERDRETCLCKIHDNLRLKLNTAHAENMYETKDLDKLCSKIVCDERNMSCMYRECTLCKDKLLPCNNNDEGKQVVWKEWKTKRFEKNGNETDETTKIVSRVVKETEKGSKATLHAEIKKGLDRACRHIYNIRQQYSALMYLREHLTATDILMHCDFSENYACKYASEIQSMHFGASKRQVSLHTGIVYTKQSTVPFCSVSDSLKHGPAAIWAHLDPVVKHIQVTQPTVKGIHFISDGPTTQYRNKQNFYLWSQKVEEYGCNMSTWNFLEASHGKGAADGIGAAVKRNADTQVNVHQKDITCAKDFLQCVTSGSTSIKFFEVSEDDITSIEDGLPNTLLPIRNTMKIHQVPKRLCLSYWLYFYNVKSD